MEGVPKSNDICPTNTIQVLKLHEFFSKILFVSFKLYFLQK